MHKLFFILGRDPDLSIAEIFSLLKSDKYKFKEELLSREVLIISTEEDISGEDLMKKLGGTVKIGEIMDEIKFEDREDRFEEILSADNLLHKYFAKKEGKIHFGISLYCQDEKNPYAALLENKLKDFTIKIKNNLREKGLNAGFVQIKERFLSSVSVEKNGLLSNGAEIVMIATNEQISVGKTESVQDFPSFSFRDFYRPAKDKKSGIMPPKLARMMINIAGVHKDSVLLDPFCGSGTIVMEGILLKIKKVMGTDISDRAISDTMRNVDWLFNNFRELDRKYYDLKMRKSDVRSLNRIFSANSIDAIVTEPHLGPPLTSRPDKKNIDKILREITPLYLSAFIQFSLIVKKGGSVVIISPAFESNEQMISMNIDGEIRKSGFERLTFGEIEQTGSSLIVGDKYSFLKREIRKYVFLPG